MLFAVAQRIPPQPQRHGQLEQVLHLKQEFATPGQVAVNARRKSAYILEEYQDGVDTVRAEHALAREPTDR